MTRVLIRLTVLIALALGVAFSGPALGSTLPAWAVTDAATPLAIGANADSGQPAVGDLSQPAGSEGCIENNPTNSGGPCATSTYGAGLRSDGYVATYGTNVYVISAYGIEVLKRDPSDPGLTDLQCVSGDGSDYGSNPSCSTASMMLDSAATGSIRISPDGKWAFVDVHDSGYVDGGELIVLARNTTTGTLTQSSCYTATGSDGGGAETCTDLGAINSLYDAGTHLAVAPNGKWLYADDGRLITSFSFNDSTGVLTPTGCAGESGIGCPVVWPADANSNAGELVVSPDDKYLYFASPSGDALVEWLSISPTTGLLSDPGTSGAEDCIEDLSSGTGDNCVSSMRGMVSQIGSLAISPDTSGTYLYALSGSEYADGGIAVLARNPSTGALTQVSGAAGCATSSGTDDENASNETGGPLPCEQDPGLEEAESLEPSPDGQNLYVLTGYEGNESLIETHIDQSTGAITEDTDVFDDCYTSSIREDAQPFCTGYAGMDGLPEGLNGEATFGISPDGTGVYVTSAGDSGLAVFERQTLPTYAVTAAASPAGGGAVGAASASTGAACSGSSCSVTAGSSVTLTATANPGYRFAGWSGGSCTGPETPCTVANVQAAETDTATFVQRVTVSATVSGPSGNGVTVTDSSANAPACTGASCTVDAGDTVTLTASVAAGDRFTGWSGGSCAGSTNPCVISSVHSSEADTASFEVIPQYTVTAVAGANAGSSSVAAVNATTSTSCPGASCTVDAGDTVELIPNPAAGYRFTGWSGGSCAATTFTCTLTNVETSQTDTATFTPGFTVSATLTTVDARAGNSVSASDTAAGATCTSASCAVNPGDTVTLTATPASGYSFGGWTGGSCAPAANPCTLTNVQAAESDHATFTANGVAVSGHVSLFASYGPGQQPVELPNSYSNVEVKVVETAAPHTVEAGPVTVGGGDDYNLVVPHGVCAHTSSCLVEVSASKGAGAVKLGDEVDVSFGATATAETVNLAYGAIGQLGLTGTVLAPDDGRQDQVSLSITGASVFAHGTGSAGTAGTTTLYASTSDICGTHGSCTAGPFLLVVSSTEANKIVGHEGQLVLSEKHGGAWVAVDSQIYNDVKAVSTTAEDVKTIGDLQAVDPAPATDEHHVVLGRLALLTPYGPTDRPPTPTKLTGYSNISVNVVREGVAGVQAKVLASASPKSDGSYEVDDIPLRSGPLESYGVDVTAQKRGRTDTSFITGVPLEPNDDPSTRVANLWFSPTGDLALDGKILPPAGDHSVKTEILVTEGGRTLYDSTTAKLCVTGSDRTGDCSVGSYLLDVSPPGGLIKVQLKELNPASNWVGVETVTVEKDAPPLLAFDFRNVADLQAVYPVPAG